MYLYTGFFTTFKEYPVAIPTLVFQTRPYMFYSKINNNPFTIVNNLKFKSSTILEFLSRILVFGFSHETLKQVLDSIRVFGSSRVLVFTSTKFFLVEYSNNTKYDQIKETLSYVRRVGPDNIPASLLFKYREVLCFPLCAIFNKSLTEGNFPAVWKISRVTSILKSGDPTIVTNYRPVSNLLFIGKLFELIVLNFECSPHSILSMDQQGLYPGRSAINSSLDFSCFICDAFRENYQVDAIFTDFSKAFDSLLILKRISFRVLTANTRSTESFHIPTFFSNFLSNDPWTPFFSVITKSSAYVVTTHSLSITILTSYPVTIKLLLIPSPALYIEQPRRYILRCRLLWSVEYRVNDKDKVPNIESLKHKFTGVISYIQRTTHNYKDHQQSINTQNRTNKCGGNTTVYPTTEQVLITNAVPTSKSRLLVSQSEGQNNQSKS
ncbi:hypothetical protein AGLY_014812 [Aphis glycines]|uniref:Reverse transcriptase domain-containing protein n=1 Tax=Aphis glycines TaxID=307491 RepID=A0A6G0T2N1_APHGL|nr:hypothetical protein AGLY_014812 [Aphis glycines]